MHEIDYEKEIYLSYDVNENWDITMFGELTSFGNPEIYKLFFERNNLVISLYVQIKKFF